MSIRQALPGETLSPSCGHHCGVRSTADEGTLAFIGHCGCPECRCPFADYPAHVNIPVIETGAEILLKARVPMCDSWGTMGLCTPASGSAG